MICGCPNCKPFQKKWNPFATPLLDKVIDDNRYIEAINGARLMRQRTATKLFDTRLFRYYYRNNANLVLKHMWQDAHDFYRSPC
jgi:hypothetical protein